MSTKSAPTRLKSRTPAPLSGRLKANVLVVDDDEEVRSLARLTLEDAGGQVIIANSGEEAVEVFTAQRQVVDIVLLDLTMPGMDGAATFRALRQIQPSTPIVLTSGYTADDVANRVGEPSLSGFIQKPWRPSELVAVLVAVLAQRQ